MGRSWRVLLEPWRRGAIEVPFTDIPANDRPLHQADNFSMLPVGRLIIERARAALVHFKRRRRYPPQLPTRPTHVTSLTPHPSGSRVARDAQPKGNGESAAGLEIKARRSMIRIRAFGFFSLTLSRKGTPLSHLVSDSSAHGQLESHRTKLH